MGEGDRKIIPTEKIIYSLYNHLKLCLVAFLYTHYPFTQSYKEVMGGVSDKDKPMTLCLFDKSI